MTIDLSTYLQDLKGRKYLPVAPRVVAFREDHPDWSIITEPMDGMVLATVMDQTGRIIATAHKTITKFAGGDVEKAETGAIGRALSLCGYGTLLAFDLEEGDEIADAPATVPAKAKPNGGAGTYPRDWPADEPDPLNLGPDPAPPAHVPEPESVVHVRDLCAIAIEANDPTGIEAIRAAVLAIPPNDKFHRSNALRWATLATVLLAPDRIKTQADIRKARGLIAGMPDATPDKGKALDILEAKEGQHAR